MSSRTPVFCRWRQKGQKVIDILTYRANMRDLAYIKRMCVWRVWGRRINRVPFKYKLPMIRSLGPFCKFPSSCNRTQLGLNQKPVDLCEHSWFSIACGNIIFVEMWCSYTQASSSSAPFSALHSVLILCSEAVLSGALVKTSGRILKESGESGLPYLITDFCLWVHLFDVEPFLNLLNEAMVILENYSLLFSWIPLASIFINNSCISVHQ